MDENAYKHLSPNERDSRQVNNNSLNRMEIGTSDDESNDSFRENYTGSNWERFKFNVKGCCTSCCTMCHKYKSYIFNALAILMLITVNVLYVNSLAPCPEKEYDFML